MAFYYYHNPEVVPHLTIHKATCGHCNNGQGKHSNVEKGNRCVWTGPFDTLEWAEKYILENVRFEGYNITYCGHCKPQY